MNKTSMLNVLTAAALVAATLSTAAFADRGDGRMGGMGPMAGFDFAAVDADKDGKITEAEMTAFRAAEAKKADTNSDGLMSVEELTALHSARIAAQASDMATRMVSRLDADGDAQLSAAELAAHPMQGMMIDRIDADNDGAITQAEIDAAQTRMAGRMGDGEGRGGWMRGMMGDHGHGMGHGMGRGMMDGDNN